MTPVLTLTVEPQGGASEDLVETIRLLAPHVDVVAVNTVGIGHVLAQRLEPLGEKLHTFNPGSLQVHR